MKNKVKELRKIQKLTQEELAELIGISRQAINAMKKKNLTQVYLLHLKWRIFLKFQ